MLTINIEKEFDLFCNYDDCIVCADMRLMEAFVIKNIVNAFPVVNDDIYYQMIFFCNMELKILGK